MEGGTYGAWARALDTSAAGALVPARSRTGAWLSSPRKHGEKRAIYVHFSTAKMTRVLLMGANFYHLRRQLGPTRPQAVPVPVVRGS